MVDVTSFNSSVVLLRLVIPNFNQIISGFYFLNFISNFSHFLPDLFSIIKMTEKLERSYVRDAVTAKDYEPACEKLISQYRTLSESMRPAVRPHWIPFPVFSLAG
jgi:hypothetical protein